ncbi:hypothetical protein BDV24DRAFT_142199 [Aspergillus arachidicola]|uniref:Uncharacterized protein n=1 Tax=Aspergillus arachidicola TaxID=656916 RepID=A0A5N6XSX7_9EURO|nr:hypothetical protein BDV24DRAFT_142199 [Aspergillus arachidicola]
MYVKPSVPGILSYLCSFSKLLGIFLSTYGVPSTYEIRHSVLQCHQQRTRRRQG